MFLWLHCCYCPDFGFQDIKKMWEFVQAALVSVGCRTIRATRGDTELALFSQMTDFCLCILISLISPVPFFRVIPGKHSFERMSQIWCWNHQTVLPVLFWAAFSELCWAWIWGEILCTTLSFYRSNELGQKSWNVSQISLWSAYSGFLTRGYCFLASLPCSHLLCC